MARSFQRGSIWCHRVFVERTGQLTGALCLTNMSDMATLQVKNREFQRSTADWLRRARQGDTVVIVSPEGPPLTMTAGRPQPPARFDWDSHFDWLNTQPVFDINPVDASRRADKR